LNAPTKRIDAARRGEADLLGRLIRHPAELPDVRDRVAVDDFHHDAHQRVYKALLRLADRGAIVDLLGVSEELRTAGEDVPGVFVAELYAEAGTGFGVTGCADRVLSLALERNLAIAAAESAAEAENSIGCRNGRPAVSRSASRKPSTSFWSNSTPGRVVSGRRDGRPGSLNWTNPYAVGWRLAA
jgi:replicative DNA helicase